MGKCLCASLCETLAYLYRDGVPVHRSLEMLIATTSFDAHRGHLRRAASTLRNTGSLCEAMDRLPYFPPVFHSMLVVVLMGIGMAILFVGVFVPIYGILAKLGGA